MDEGEEAVGEEKDVEADIKEDVGEEQDVEVEEDTKTGKHGEAKRKQRESRGIKRLVMEGQTARDDLPLRRAWRKNMKGGLVKERNEFRMRSIPNC